MVVSGSWSVVRGSWFVVRGPWSVVRGRSSTRGEGLATFQALFLACRVEGVCSAEAIQRGVAVCLAELMTVEVRGRLTVYAAAANLQSSGAAGARRYVAGSGEDLPALLLLV